MTWPPDPQPPCDPGCSCYGPDPVPPAPESAYPPDAVELPETKRPGPFRRIINATRRTT